MGRFLAAAMVSVLLVAAPASSPASPLPPTYEEIFEQLSTDIGLAVDALPAPPTSKEEKKALKAWNSAAKTVDKALAKPSGKGFTKAAGKVNKTLSKAFPDDGGVQLLLEQLASDMVAATGTDLSDLFDAVDSMPDGALKDQLLESIGVIDETLNGGYIDAAAAHKLCVAATKALGGVEKKYNKSLGKSSGKEIVKATVGGAGYTSSMVEGAIVKNLAGQPRYLTVNGVRSSAGFVVENLDITIDMLPGVGTILPGTYTIDPENLVQVSYLKTSPGGLLEAVECTSGSITITSINPAAGTATGTFQGSGPSLDGPTVDIVSGQFNAAGLVVTVEE